MSVRLTLGVGCEGRKPALDQNSAILQQGAHKAPRGGLAQQVHQELGKALAVQQHRGGDLGLLAGLLGHRLLQHLRFKIRG